MKSLAQPRRIIVALTFLASTLYAGSSTWKSNPVSNDWNIAGNWTPETIPSSETDVATFQASNITNLICGHAPGGSGTSTIVGDIVFAPGASAYTITVTPVDTFFPSLIEVHHSITNNSGVAQNFVTANSSNGNVPGRIYFIGSASAGENVVITNQGGASNAPANHWGDSLNSWTRRTPAKQPSLATVEQ